MGDKILTYNQGSLIVRPLNQQLKEQDSRAYRPLIILEDIFKASDLKEGFVAAKHTSLMINSEFYDFAARYSDSETDHPEFYNIPILNSNSIYGHEILSLAAYNFRQTGKRRHFVRSPGKRNPELLEIDPNRDYKPFFIPYYITDYDTFIPQLDKEQRKQFKKTIEKIVSELGSR